LLRSDAQRELLDGQGGLSALARDVAQRYSHWNQLRQQLQRFENDAKNLLQKKNGWNGRPANWKNCNCVMVNGKVFSRNTAASPMPPV
jgi:uncharacterized protein YhaN